MQRYTVLLLASFTFLVIAIAGSMYLSGYADKTKPDSSLPSIVVYTTLPIENVAPLAEEYEKSFNVRVSFVPLGKSEILSKAADVGKADLVLSDSGVLNTMASSGWLVPYFSEMSDLVQDNLKEKNNFWVGAWYDPVVFCMNKDFVSRREAVPMSWQELAADKKSRIGITDFLAADASANLLFALVSQYGEENTMDMARQLHPRVVKYAKYLSTPARMAGMGEVDISVAVYSEAMRYVYDGFPITIACPKEGTAYTVVGTGLLLGSAHEEQAKAFADWLQGDDANLALQRNNFHFIPTNKNTLAYKKLTNKNMPLFIMADLPEERKNELLGMWMNEVRMN